MLSTLYHDYTVEGHVQNSLPWLQSGRSCSALFTMVTQWKVMFSTLYHGYTVEDHVQHSLPWLHSGRSCSSLFTTVAVRQVEWNQAQTNESS